MTRTRYMTDALETTNEHIEAYLEELETAKRTGRSRARVINRNFDMLSYDLNLRFMQTVGCVKALALLAPAEPLKTRLAVLLGRTLDDLDFMESRCADNDPSPKKRGNDHNSVCRDIAERFDASLRLWSDLARDIAGIAGRSPLASAGPAIAAQIMLDLDMLAEQFRDFLHDGTTELYEPDDEDEQGAAAKAA